MLTPSAQCNRAGGLGPGVGRVEPPAPRGQARCAGHALLEDGTASPWTALRLPALRSARKGSRDIQASAWRWASGEAPTLCLRWDWGQPAPSPGWETSPRGKAAGAPGRKASGKEKLPTTRRLPGFRPAAPGAPGQATPPGLSNDGTYILLSRSPCERLFQATWPSGSWGSTRRRCGQHQRGLWVFSQDPSGGMPDPRDTTFTGV